MASCQLSVGRRMSRNVQVVGQRRKRQGYVRSDGNHDRFMEKQMTTYSMNELHTSLPPPGRTPAGGVANRGATGQWGAKWCEMRRELVDDCSGSEISEARSQESEPVVACNTFSSERLQNVASIKME